MSQWVQWATDQGYPNCRRADSSEFVFPICYSKCRFDNKYYCTFFATRGRIYKLGFYIWATLLLVPALYHSSHVIYHVFSRGSPDQLSTITASIPFWETHFERVENINGILRFIASICFLWRIGAIGSVLVASINIFVKRPPFSSVNLKKYWYDSYHMKFR